MEYKTKFETERLILRRWEESDAESCYKYAKNPNVGPMGSWPIHTSVENSLEIIRTVLQKEGNYAICLKENNKAIGSIGFFQSHNNCAKEGELEIGFWIGEPFWGNGYVPEAVREIQKYCFEELGSELIWCVHWDKNIKSRKAQMKCGFVYHHTEENCYNSLIDEYRNHCVNVLTKEEWMKNKK